MNGISIRILAILSPPSPSAPLPLLSTLDVAKRLNARFGVVTGALYELKDSGRLVGTASGLWRLASRPPRLSDEQARLATALKNASSDVRMGELARAARIARRDLRRILDELVAIGAIVERGDGCYEVLV